MTCIAGLVYNGKVYIGADSAGVSGFDLAIRADEKAFKIGPFVFGFTSSFRMGQLLRFSFKPPKRPGGISDYEFMCTKFINAVRKCLKNGGYSEVKNNQEKGGQFLVGYRGVLYMVGSDFQVGKSLDGFDAVGCGEAYAKTSLYVSRVRDPQQRLLNALGCSEHFSAGVRGPFIVVCGGGRKRRKQ